MITSYEVGAALLVEDRATVTLTKTLDLVKALTEQFARLRELTESIFSETGARSFNRTLLTTERRMGTVITQTDLLARSMQGLAAASATAGAGVASVAGAGAGGGGGAAVVGGGGHGRITPLVRAGKWAGVGGAALTGFSVWEAAKLQDTVARALVTAGVPISGGMMDMPEAKQLVDVITRTATTTGIGFGGTEQTALQVLRTMAPLPFAKRMSVMPAIMDFMAQEVLQKGVSPEEAGTAAVELAHMTAQYQPDEIAKLLPAFARMSMASPASLNQLTRSLSYSLPIITRGAGIDEMTALVFGAIGSQMGLNTKSGTWIAQLVQRSFPAVAGLTGHAQGAHMAGLRVLGLVDERGQSTVMDAQGRLDLVKELQVLHARMSALPPVVREAALMNAFGQQGQRAAELFSDPKVLQNILALRQNLIDAPDPAKSLAELTKNSPVVQVNVAMQNMTAELIHLGNNVLPALTTALHGLNATMDYLKQHPVLQGLVGAGIVGAGGLWALNKLTFGALLGGAGARIGGAAISAITGTAFGATAAAGLTTILPIIVAAVVTYMAAYYVGGGAANWGINSLVRAASHGKSESLGDAFWSLVHPWDAHAPTTTTARGRGAGAASGAGGVHVHGDVTIKLQPQDVAGAHTLAEALSRALTRQSSSEGSISSPSFVHTP